MARISCSIEVNCPIEQCYKGWIDFENYDQFVEHLKGISQKGDPNVWQMIISGPNNQELSWDFELDGGKHQNNVISWHTVRAADVPHSGAITLEETGINKTKINMVVDFQPSGKVTEEDLTRYVKEKIQQTMENYKSWIESAMEKTAATQAARSGQGQTPGSSSR